MFVPTFRQRPYVSERVLLWQELSEKNLLSLISQIFRNTNMPKRDFSSCLEFKFGFFRFVDSTLGPPVHPRLQENVTVFLWVQHPSLLFLTFVFTSAVSLGKVVFTLIHTRNCPGKPQSDLTAVVNSSTGIV